MKKVLKPVTCMAFGYVFLLMVMSEVFPATAPLTLTAAFFVHFMERRSFLTMVLIQSAYATLMTFIYWDAVRAAFLGIDVFYLMAYASIAPVCLLTGNLEAILHIPDSLLLAAGIITMLASCIIVAIAENWIIVLLLRKVGFYQRIGKTCPKEWSIWKG